MQIMKNHFLLFLLAAITMTACDKTSLQSNGAQLIGIDFRKCASPFCGGWFVEIDGQTLRFFETPAETDIDFSGDLEFPIPVNVVWKKYENEWKDVADLIFVEQIKYKD
jgi:hypothetical protein